MNVKIENLVEKDDILTFRLSGVNVSLANALRRTILSDIPMVVFKTSPYEQNKATIHTNTSRLNNEILKQRLSCIPIHIKDTTIPLEHYQLEVQVENDTDTILYVTTEHFKVKNLLKGDYLKDRDIREIFPSSEYGFIDFVRLRPRISEEIPGEKIHLTCAFSVGTAKEDGMFNCVSTCSYGFTVDTVKMEEALGKKKQEWKDQGMKEEAIAFEATNWKLLDGQRVYLQNSFDFVVQTVGVHTNQEILHKACEILCEKLLELNTLMQTDQVEIKPSETTMKNAFDIIMENEDYTIGKVVEYFLNALFFEDTKILNFVGFMKKHPHDSFSTIRLAYKDGVEKVVIKENIGTCIEEALKVFKQIKVLL